jgi:hypothetical protein
MWNTLFMLCTPIFPGEWRLYVNPYSYRCEALLKCHALAIRIDSFIQSLKIEFTIVPILLNFLQI